VGVDRVVGYRAGSDVILIVGTPLTAQGLESLASVATRTEEQFDGDEMASLSSGKRVPVEVPRLIHIVELGKRHDLKEPASGPWNVGVGEAVVWRPCSMEAGVGKPTMRVVEVVAGDPELPEVAGGPDAVGRHAHLLDRRQQQGDQDPDDGDHHQQFDECEAARTLLTKLHESTSSY